MAEVNNKITIICTEEQEKAIKEYVCIFQSDDGCAGTSCEGCSYDTDNIEFRRRYYEKIKLKSEECLFV